jgi:phosphatidylglycerophosphate synthase
MSYSFAELERRCQKPDHRRMGNWMARRVARPLALRVTRVVLPWGLSAHGATLAAWAMGVAAAMAFGWGSVGGWLLGAGLLQVWYLLDHVDGQIARFRGTASLDGVQLDYLMHHTLNLLVPLGVGWGLALRATEPLWTLAGLAWGLGALVLGLWNDTRYKAFTQRLKRVRGELRVIGGGGARPLPASGMPRDFWQQAAWFARKACEPQVTMNLLGALAIGQAVLGDQALVIGRCWLAVMAPLAVLVATITIARSIRRQAAEAEFAAWYQPPAGHDLVFEDGWWHIQPTETTVRPSRASNASGTNAGPMGDAFAAARRSS